MVVRKFGMEHHYAVNHSSELLNVTLKTLHKLIAPLDITAYRIGANSRGRYIPSQDIDLLRTWMNKKIVQQVPPR